MTTKAKVPDVSIKVDPVNNRTIEVPIVGTMPLIQHRMAEKGLRDLLFPPPKKTAADKAANMKHDPMQEFRDAAERMPAGAPTLLGLMSTAFKGAMMTASLDLPSVTKARVGRLSYIEGERVPVWGVPKLGMSVVRMADIGRTPDVRTRPILPRWASLLRVTFIAPMLNERSVVNLLASAGLTCGVGDWRQEKGRGSYGQFRVTNHDDPEWLDIRKEGREAQEAAMTDPQPYDDLTAELLGWFRTEVERRGVAA